MSTAPHRRMLGGTIAGAFAVILASTPAMAAGYQGASSSETPYLVPVAPGVKTMPILTVGDTPTQSPNYRMGGIPDGLGALRNVHLEHDDRPGNQRGRQFTLLSNHEMRPEQGRVRDHGAAGAFVSKWTIDRKNLEVIKGEDLIQWVRTNSDGDATWDAAAKGIVMSRLCSADLPAQSALYDRDSRRGYRDGIFFSGEEAGNEGRAFAHVLDGTSWELPHLGNMSFENVVANPGSGEKTVVVGLDDTSGGQLYVYVGTKQTTGTPIEKAGLANGPLYGVKVPSLPVDPDGPLAQTPMPFQLVEIPAAASKTGAQIESDSNALAVTRFLRPEDGAWDPRDPRDFYFLTTDNYDSTKPDGQSAPGGVSGFSRLWRLRFDDARQPQLGGAITPLLDGKSEPVQMLDNITITTTGHALLQEDPGNQTRSARIWLYDLHDDSLTVIAKHDPARFGEWDQAPAEPPMTTDEESSGIIPAFDILGRGWFLLDVQAHTAPRAPYTALTAELVEDGQYLALFVPQVLRQDDDDEGERPAK